MTTSHPSLVLLPGMLCDATLWMHQATYLADIAEPQVIDLTREDSVAGMATRVLNAAPDSFALAGLSMGGYVALEIMREAPERVSRLALLDTSARADTREQKRRRKMLIALAQSGKFKGVTPRLMPLLVHADRLGDAELCDAIMRMANRIGKDAFVRQETAILERPDGRHRLAEITCPTLLVFGRQDALTPLDYGEEMAAAIPRARLAVVEECGHLSTMERPHAVTALLRDWLLYR